MSIKPLKEMIMAALADATSQKPMDTVKIYVLGEYSQIECDWSQFEAALLELYHAREINCCKVTKGGKESILWWKAGVYLSQFDRGKSGPKAKA